MEGSLENPHSAGTLCSKGAAQRQWVYHEDRLRTPLKRVGPRGSGEMVPISWTEALDTIAENLQRLKAESGPESVVFYCGYPKQLRPFLQRLAFLYGSPNYCTESSTCFTAMAMGWRLDYGQMAGPDLANTKCSARVDAATPSTPTLPTPAGSWTPASGGSSSSWSTRASRPSAASPTSICSCARAPTAPWLWPWPT